MRKQLTLKVFEKAVISNSNNKRLQLKPFSKASRLKAPVVLCNNGIFQLLFSDCNFDDNRVQIVTGFLFCLCWDTPSVNTGL